MADFRTTALSVVGGVAAAGGALAGAAYEKAKQFRNRPSIEHRTSARISKGPVATRVATAAAIRSDRMGNAIETASTNPHRAVMTVAHEVSHLGGQFAKTVEDARDYGFVSSGGFMDNLKRGALFINGQHFSINTALLNFFMMKSSKLYRKTAAMSGSAFSAAGLREFIAPSAKPLKVLYGARYVALAADQAVGPDDAFGYTPNGSGGGYTVTQADVVGTWPLGTFVFQGTEAHMAPDWQLFAKTAAGVLLWTREHLAFKILSLFTESLGSIVGIAGGVDFAH